jgi:D-arabinose 1-dehydrogenase-like Zn-dependent alcohol dehydrogenase
MLAARLTTGEGQIRLEEVGIPEPGPGEVRVKVEFAGICASDLHFISGELASGMPRQVTLGHEVSGVIDKWGTPSGQWADGTQVAVHAMRSVGGSIRIMGVHYDGGWAEYVVVPGDSVVPLSANVDLGVAAIIPDAVTTPWAAITDSGQVRPGESAAVWGLGGLGYHAVVLLRLVGAAPLIAIDPLQEARSRALAAGADLALDPLDPEFSERVKEAAGEGGLDVAFDFFGGPGVAQQAFDALGPGGRMVLVGITPAPLHVDNTSLLIRHSKRILGHYGIERRHIEEIMKLLEYRRLELSGSISQVYPLSHVHEAVERLTSKVDNPVRILLKP